MISVPRFTAQPASADHHLLAEGPLWDAPRKRVLWVDILAARVHEGRLDGNEVTTTRTHDLVDLGPTVGAVVVGPDGELLVAGHRGLVVLDVDGHRRDTVDVVPPGVDSRLNDGACDPAGRFLVGTLSLDGRAGEEMLVRVEDSTAMTVLDHDLTISNGLAWSPDGRQLYSVDSVPGTVWSRDYDAVTGRVGPRRTLTRVTDGLPDGVCVDAEGALWVACWDAGQVRRIAPDGTLLAVVEVDAPHTSSVAFIGPQLDTLLITTARSDLTANEHARFPDAGRLFLAVVGVRGLPATPWRGFDHARAAPHVDL